jgi:hypothetical protein
VAGEKAEEAGPAKEGREATKGVPAASGWRRDDEGRRARNGMVWFGGRARRDSARVKEGLEFEIGRLRGRRLCGAGL